MSLLSFSETLRWVTTQKFPESRWASLEWSLLSHHTRKCSIIFSHTYQPTLWGLFSSQITHKFLQMKRKFWLMCCARDNSVQYWYNIDSIVFMIRWLTNLSLVGVGFSMQFFCVCLFSFKKIASVFTIQLWKVLEVSSDNTIKDFSPVKCSQHLL